MKEREREKESSKEGKRGRKGKQGIKGKGEQGEGRKGQRIKSDVHVTIMFVCLSDRINKDTSNFGGR